VQGGGAAAGGSRIIVCHLTHDLGDGGAERLLVELAAVAPSAGIDVRVLSLLPNAGQRNAARLRSLGVPVATAGLAGMWDPRGFHRAAAHLRAVGAALVHTHQKQADLVGAVASRFVGIPQVSTLHRIDDAATGAERLKAGAGAGARARSAARTIAVSDAQRDWYLRTFRCDPAKVVTVRNGVTEPRRVDAAARAATRRDLGVPEGAVMAIMLGVMRPGKGHEELITAAGLLPTTSPVCFVAAGDGPLLDELRARVAAAALPAGRLLLPGWRSDTDELLAASDLVVHPSLFDALPTALIQGLAAGRPAVASEVGGIPEVVDETCGVLVPPGDPASFAAAVQALAEDQSRRAALGASARRRYLEEFSAEVWINRLRRVYEQALAA
jgi:glycosyltransferase involved in cell wall biosynthesis